MEAAAAVATAVVVGMVAAAVAALGIQMETSATSVHSGAIATGAPAVAGRGPAARSGGHVRASSLSGSLFEARSRHSSAPEVGTQSRQERMAAAESRGVAGAPEGGWERVGGVMSGTHGWSPNQRKRVSVRAGVVCGGVLSSPLCQWRNGGRDAAPRVTHRAMRIMRSIVHVSQRWLVCPAPCRRGASRGQSVREPVGSRAAERWG
jgi:hypothetical protein